MNNNLLLRRRMMMQQRKRYKIDWYPIIQGPVTSQDMINELGDLFQTYEDAPDTFNNRQKTSAFALSKSLTSAQFGVNVSPNCIVYEEGQAPIRITTWKQTVTFTSTETYKHVVCYGGSFGGNQNLSGVRWWINTSGLNAKVVLGVKYLHIAYKSNAATWIGGDIYKPNPRGYAGSVYYIPDWWSGTMNPQRFKLCSKIRFSKGVSSMSNSEYFWGGTQSELPNLTDIYVHWGLGEVPRQPGRSFTGQWKLHIPDLGNANLNTALVDEYRSKGWNYVSGLGIFNNVEESEPEEQLN